MNDDELIRQIRRRIHALLCEYNVEYVTVCFKKNRDHKKTFALVGNVKEKRASVLLENALRSLNDKPIKREQL